MNLSEGARGPPDQKGGRGHFPQRQGAPGRPGRGAHNAYLLIFCHVRSLFCNFVF